MEGSNTQVKPWMLSKQDAENWRRLGIEVSTTEDTTRHITGVCKLAACPTAVNVTTGRRLRSKCETWTSSEDVDGRVFVFDE